MVLKEKMEEGKNRASSRGHVHCSEMLGVFQWIAGRVNLLFIGKVCPSQSVDSIQKID